MWISGSVYDNRCFKRTIKTTFSLQNNTFYHFPLMIWINEYFLSPEFLFHALFSWIIIRLRDCIRIIWNVLSAWFKILTNIQHVIAWRLAWLSCLSLENRDIFFFLVEIHKKSIAKIVIHLPHIVKMGNHLFCIDPTYNDEDWLKTTSRIKLKRQLKQPPWKTQNSFLSSSICNNFKDLWNTR